MVKDFEILDHPSDVRVRVFGKTKEEVFLNAMRGMNAVLKPQIKSPKSQPKAGPPRAEKIKNKISVKSIDLNALLVDFLSEVLYQIQTKKEIYNNIKFTEFSDKELEGELIGNKVESFGEDIKAVTYHGLKIEKNKEDLWKATVLFDI